MKPRRSTTHPATALVLTAVAVFTLLGNRCGLLGQLLTACLAKLLGVPGTALVVCTLFAVAFVLAFPGRLTKLFASVHSMEGRPADDLPPKARRALQDVRTALKGLGYTANEINPVVDALDQTMPLEKAVKAALKQLNVN